MRNEQSMVNMKQNVVLEKSFQFSIRIVRLYQYLVNEKKEFVLAKQVLRSGTSIGANIEEAEGGFSKKDFKSKMNIAYKEARETKYWLRLLNATDYLDEKLYNSLILNCEEILKLLYNIIKTSKSK
jgi:four helix bundle protein